MTKYTIQDGTIEIYSESKFHDILRETWGKCEEMEQEEGLDHFIKFGHTVGAWIEGAGCGWIEMPHWFHSEPHIHF